MRPWARADDDKEGSANIVGVPRTLRAIDSGPLDRAGVEEAYAVGLALVALAVAVAMVVLLAALRDVSLDAPVPVPANTA